MRQDWLPLRTRTADGRLRRPSDQSESKHGSDPEVFASEIHHCEMRQLCVLPSFPFLDAHSPRGRSVIDGGATYDSRRSLPRTGGCKDRCNPGFIKKIVMLS